MVTPTTRASTPNVAQPSSSANFEAQFRLDDPSAVYKSKLRSSASDGADAEQRPSSRPGSSLAASSSSAPSLGNLQFRPTSLETMRAQYGTPPDLPGSPFPFQSRPSPFAVDDWAADDDVPLELRVLEPVAVALHRGTTPTAARVLDARLEPGECARERDDDVRGVGIRAARVAVHLPGGRLAPAAAVDTADDRGPGGVSGAPDEVCGAAGVGFHVRIELLSLVSCVCLLADASRGSLLIYVI
ncbi:hypothetical protein DAEQUDRAFT_280428 [Daedalea quercina L-15889]|uniref:Uncharacterized protein n=1 Tax=Daedalea quercina L-15889 TaxID=1314783 RepID=A0A165Q904_9APHY|nr:hypothetical protein DAEQUDRAFT_280428 [Daedalea quercina L-15889]